MVCHLYVRELPPYWRLVSLNGRIPTRRAPGYRGILHKDSQLIIATLVAKSSLVPAANPGFRRIGFDIIAYARAYFEDACDCRCTLISMFHVLNISIIKLRFEVWSDLQNFIIHFLKIKILIFNIKQY